MIEFVAAALMCPGIVGWSGTVCKYLSSMVLNVGIFGSASFE